MPLDMYAGIYVRDIEVARSWYGRLLGSEPSFVASDTEVVWELAEHRSIAIAAIRACTCGLTSADGANGRDLKEPYISPVYGDFSGFPPAILTSGTRDLFLSNTVRVHRKLRRAGVVADLNVYEGQSHAQYALDPSAPETREAFTDIARFFDRNLGR